MGTFWAPSGLAWSPKAPGKLKTRVPAAGVRACCRLGTRTGPHGQQGLLPDLWTYAPCCRAQTLGHKRPPLLPVDTRKGLRAKVLLAQRDGRSPIRPSTRRGSEVSRV